MQIEGPFLMLTVNVYVSHDIYVGARGSRLTYKPTYIKIEEKFLRVNKLAVILSPRLAARADDARHRPVLHPTFS